MTKFKISYFKLEKMDKLPIELKEKIFYYSGIRNILPINKEFNEIAKHMKWGTFKIIDLSTIKMDELIFLSKDVNFKYVKIITTKHRKLDDIKKAARYLFDLNNFRFTGIYFKSCLCLKSKDAIKHLNKVITLKKTGHLWANSIAHSILYYITYQLHSENIRLKNLIIDLNDYCEYFTKELTDDNINGFINFMVDINDHFFNIIGPKFKTLDNFIFINCNFNREIINKSNNFSNCIVYNKKSKNIYIDFNKYSSGDVFRFIVRYKPKNISIQMWHHDKSSWEKYKKLEITFESSRKHLNKILNDIYNTDNMNLNLNMDLVLIKTLKV